MQMSGKNKIEKWLLADWNVSHNNSGANRGNEEMKVLVNLQSNEENTMQEIDHERPLLEQQQRILKTSQSVSREENIPHEGRDYSPSASSWAPTDESSSDDSDRVREGPRSKSIKVDHYVRHYAKKRNSKKPLTPMHRPNAVVKVLQERRININNSMNESRKRKYKETQAHKSLPDSTRKNVTPPNESVTDTVDMKKKVIMEIKTSFEEIFQIINEMKPESERYICTRKYFSDITTAITRDEKTTNTAFNNTDVGEESEKSQGEESNRSDDNVLISNKYKKALVTKNQPENYQREARIEENEWIPIGSGKTLIHKEKFRKVNWKSYTIATRTLLLATFPRRILATHSLTGKRSPAFLDKPAKMCLDPKIVSDIIIEITSKFNVKENLVRSAITTKLADECKMYRTRVRNKDKSRRKGTTPLNNPNIELKQVKTE